MDDFTIHHDLHSRTFICTYCQLHPYAIRVNVAMLVFCALSRVVSLNILLMESQEGFPAVCLYGIINW